MVVNSRFAYSPRHLKMRAIVNTRCMEKASPLHSTECDQRSDWPASPWNIHMARESSGRNGSKIICSTEVMIRTWSLGRNRPRVWLRDIMKNRYRIEHQLGRKDKQRRMGQIFWAHTIPGFRIVQKRRPEPEFPWFILLVLEKSQSKSIAVYIQMYVGVFDVKTWPSGSRPIIWCLRVLKAVGHVPIHT